jgi:hypothetical protein
MWFQVGVKSIAGAKFGGAIRECYDTVKIAIYNIVGWTLTQDISKVDIVKCDPFVAVVVDGKLSKHKCGVLGTLQFLSN